MSSWIDDRIKALAYRLVQLPEVQSGAVLRQVEALLGRAEDAVRLSPTKD